VSEATQAKAAERKARDAEKEAKDQLETTRQELTSTTARLNETEGRLTRTASDLENTKVEKDTAQRELAAWNATGVKPDQINALRARAQRLIEERNAFAEEKKVMGREITRLNEELDVYRGRVTEVALPRNWFAKFQIVEYMRSFLLFRMACASQNAVVLIRIRSW
jgi:chromosome segregation ATPase